VIGRAEGKRYGTVVTVEFAMALGNWGHVIGIEMRFGRRYSYRGKRRSLISAGCPASKGFPGAVFTLARATFSFSGGKTLTATLTRSCVVRRRHFALRGSGRRRTRRG